MLADENIATKLIQHTEANHSEFKLKLKEQTIPLSDVKIYKTENPVDRPTRRGGVYISDRYSYKLKGTIYDISIIPMLSKTMLGPNTDFTEIEITTTLTIDQNEENLSIFTHLTNSMHNSEKIELNLTIVRFEY